MLIVVQRVARASVEVEGRVVASIERGLLLLACAVVGDSEGEADWLAEKLAGLRIFDDAQGRTNLALADVGGAVLLVPQFTLAADTRSGTRPGFSTAAAPAEGERLFGYFVDRARHLHAQVVTGRFGADMQVSLTNDGPVTIWLQVKSA